MGAKSYESKNETRRSKTQRHSPKERCAFLIGDAFHGNELMDSPAPNEAVHKYHAEADEPEISAECVHRVRVHRVPLIGSRCLTHVESAPLAATMEVSKSHGPQQGAALMKRTTKHVALDVHQATTVASVREDSGRVIARAILPTEEAALVEFFRGMRGTIHVACEEGTQAQWVHDLLVPLVDRVVVCERRGESRSGNKADQVDADQLSEQLRWGNLRAVYHASAERTTLKELTRSYTNLVEDSTRVMLRLKALFRARGIPAPGQRV